MKWILDTIYVMLPDGRCLFSTSYIKKPPPVQLITGFLGASNDILQELTGEELTAFSTNRFTVKIKNFQNIIVVASLDSKSQNDIDPILELIGIEFVKIFSEVLLNWNGDVSIFDSFTERLDQVLVSANLTEREDPWRTLDSISLLKLSEDLQKIAFVFLEIGHCKVKDLSKHLEISEEELGSSLEKLRKLGYIGRAKVDSEIEYFLTKPSKSLNIQVDDEI